MNKQQLTKTLSFSKWLLFFFLAVGITLSSCGKDYDDDIAKLRDQIGNDEGYKGLTTQIAQLTASLDAAKKVAEEAQTTAQQALDEAKAGTDAHTKATADLKTATDRITELEGGRTNLETVSTDLTSRITALEATGGGQTDIDAIVALVKPELEKVAAEIVKLLGHRVTSLVRIPTQTLNDEPAIIFRTLSYVPQVFHAAHFPYTVNGVDSQGDGEVTLDIAGASRLYIDNRSTLVKYQVSPSVSVKKADISAPYFMGDIQDNANLRTIKSEMTGKDLPIKVDSWELDEATGILSVKVTKSVPSDENINFEGEGETGFNAQKYYIASLRTIIPESDRTDEEKANGTIPEVASEYSRLAEVTVVPMIKQVGSVAHAAHLTGTVDRMELLNGKDVAGKYVHYHDSVSLYDSNNTQLVDHKVEWDADVDLTKYVTVCDFENLYINPDGTIKASTGSHLDIENYKDYGLEFRFALASTPYNLGDHDTDQQQFAVLDGTIMTSKTYTIAGKAETAVGREPIVRVQLIDTRNNNNLVAQRYIKFEWTEKSTVENIDVDFPLDTVTCKMTNNTLYTKEMNEEFYRKISKEYGVSKDKFHSTYKQTQITSLTKDGVEILASPLTWATLDDTSNAGSGITTAQANAYAKNSIDEQNNEDVVFAMAKDQNTSANSYNLIWYMSPAAVGTIKDFKESTYVLTVKFKDVTGSKDLVVKFTEKIVIPDQKFDYQDTYWEGTAGNVAKINPIVYDGQRDYQLVAPNVAVSNYAWTTWNTGKDSYNHIGADLVKGYVNSVTKLKPANLAEYIRYIRSCADVRFEFDDERFGNYSHLAGFTVTNSRQALWSNSQPELNDVELQTYSHPGTQGDSRYDKLAATIWNQFGATALENQSAEAKNLPWRLNETLGTGNNIASSQLNLSEINPSDGSTAATSLVGKKVPVNLIVEYNAYNQVPVQKIEVKIIDPLNVTPSQPGSFTDAVVNGSYINVEQGVTYTDWNSYLASRTVLTPPENVTKDDETIKWVLSQKIWDFYQVRNVVFQTSTAKTNLQLVGNVYTPVAGVTDGNLPSGTVIKQVQQYDQISGAFTEVAKDPVYLRYFNDNGTPVNKQYEIYMDVTVRYKWGIKTSNVTIPVVPAGGVINN